VLPVNIVLNLALIPRTGIVGAAMATMLSYFVMWLIVVAVCRRFGMSVSARTLLVSLTPVALLLPGFWASALVLVVVLLSLLTPAIFRPDERVLARNEIIGFLARLRSARGGRGGPPEPPGGRGRPEAGEGPEGAPGEPGDSQ
jgi:hypothetical protein